MVNCEHAQFASATAHGATSSLSVAIIVMPITSCFSCRRTQQSWKRSCRLCATTRGLTFQQPTWTLVARAQCVHFAATATFMLDNVPHLQAFILVRHYLRSALQQTMGLKTGMLASSCPTLSCRLFSTTLLSQLTYGRLMLVTAVTHLSGMHSSPVLLKGGYARCRRGARPTLCPMAPAPLRPPPPPLSPSRTAACAPSTQACCRGWQGTSTGRCCRAQACR